MSEEETPGRDVTPPDIIIADGYEWVYAGNRWGEFDRKRFGGCVLRVFQVDAGQVIYARKPEQLLREATK